jgi:hypothetical protein
VAPALAAALEDAAEGGTPDDTLRSVVAALRGSRVLVPVLAQVEVAARTADGLAVDTEASAGVVALRTPDGRVALPVFSGIAALSAWHPEARPVPAEGPRAAAAALQEGWQVMVLDPAGPVTVEIPRPAVRALAGGQPWSPAVEAGMVRGEVRAAVRTCLADVGPLDQPELEPGRRAEVAVVLPVRPGLGRADLDALLAEVGRRLAEDEVVTDLVDSLEVRVVTASDDASPAGSRRS